MLFSTKTKLFLIKRVSEEARKNFYTFSGHRIKKNFVQLETNVFEKYSIS